MCILTYIPAGVDVPWEGLVYGGLYNPDGFGYAVAKGSNLLIGKSMDLDKALDMYADALDSMPGAVSIFHSRIATAGTVDEYNIHPFYVGGREDSIMAHNGILPSKWQPGLKDRRSDTRLFADLSGEFIDNARGVPSRKLGQRIGQAIGSYNKLIYMSVKSGAPVVRIINAHMGVWTDGVWHSNYSYEKPAPRKSAWGTSYFTKETLDTYWEKEDVPGKVECALCRGDDVEYGYCMDCTACQECLAFDGDCLCYIPAHMKQGAVGLWNLDDGDEPVWDEEALADLDESPTVERLQIEA